MLYRLGFEASLTLGNKKSVDIMVALESGDTVTIDVKGLAGKTGWPVDNVRKREKKHFLIFVCFKGKIQDCTVPPEVYVVPSMKLPPLVYHAPGGTRKVITLSKMRKEGGKFCDAWNLLELESHQSLPDPVPLTSSLPQGCPKISPTHMEPTSTSSDRKSIPGTAKMNFSELDEIRNEFLNRWPLVAIKKMTLPEYVGVRNKDTFCQWVETKTAAFGNIKGGTSIKFGIYERLDPNKKPKVYRNDDKYSWWPKYGNDRNTAFKKIKNAVIETIELSGKGEFHLIDDILLMDLFKWKIAFLYSNYGLIPIYKREWLFKIARHLGLRTTRNTKVSEIQSIMMSNMPALRKYNW